MRGGDNPEDCHAAQNDYWMRCHRGDACRASGAARPRDGSLSSFPAPSPLRSLSSLPTSPLRSLSSLSAPPLRSLSSLPASPLRYALIRTGTLVLCSALQGSKEHQMKTIISILAVAFLAICRVRECPLLAQCDVCFWGKADIAQIRSWRRSP